MKQSPLTLRRWGRVEYERLVDLGAFENDPVELIGGQLIVAEPKGSEHATAVGMADDALRVALPSGWIVRGQDPVKKTIRSSRNGPIVDEPTDLPRNEPGTKRGPIQQPTI